MPSQPVPAPLPFLAICPGHLGQTSQDKTSQVCIQGQRKGEQARQGRKKAGQGRAGRLGTIGLFGDRDRAGKAGTPATGGGLPSSLKKINKLARHGGGSRGRKEKLEKEGQGSWPCSLPSIIFLHYPFLSSIILFLPLSLFAQEAGLPPRVGGCRKSVWKRGKTSCVITSPTVCLLPANLPSMLLPGKKRTSLSALLWTVHEELLPFCCMGFLL